MTTFITSKVLGTKHTIDIIRHLHSNGECTQKDMQDVITMNNRTLHRRLALLEENDLIDCDIKAGRSSRHRSKYWKLTSTGEASADLLDKLETAMSGGFEGE